MHAAQRARATATNLQQKQINVIERPANSPDLNPIEIIECVGTRSGPTSTIIQLKYKLGSKGTEPLGRPCGRSSNDCIRSDGIKCENVICCDGWPSCNEKFCVCETAKGYKYDDALEGCNHTGVYQHELSKDCNNSAEEMANLG
ncbi:hypothetical protein MAR_034970 [Mya arenaria]|uniref:Uncharacterized protein n=1 Tax=Mya arenaria TaxID=6604 RepID=A0ABY7ELK8_MYAAR|nr:hypothetical protein MAR_034970 [Mya arenaria]